MSSIEQLTHSTTYSAGLSKKEDLLKLKDNIFEGDNETTALKTTTIQQQKFKKKKKKLNNKLKISGSEIGISNYYSHSSCFNKSYLSDIAFQKTDCVFYNVLDDRLDDNYS